MKSLIELSFVNLTYVDRAYWLETYKPDIHLGCMTPHMLYVIIIEHGEWLSSALLELTNKSLIGYEKLVMMTMMSEFNLFKVFNKVKPLIQPLKLNKILDSDEIIVNITLYKAVCIRFGRLVDIKYLVSLTEYFINTLPQSVSLSKLCYLTSNTNILSTHTHLLIKLVSKVYVRSVITLAKEYKVILINNSRVFNAFITRVYCGDVIELLELFPHSMRPNPVTYLNKLCITSVSDFVDILYYVRNNVDNISSLIEFCSTYIKYTSSVINVFELITVLPLDIKSSAEVCGNIIKYVCSPKLIPELFRLFVSDIKNTYSICLIALNYVDILNITNLVEQFTPQYQTCAEVLDIIRVRKCQSLRYRMYDNNNSSYERFARKQLFFD